ncbi:immunity 63 family protein [Mycobacterium avium subsp. paratuberculosis]|uniref:Immunity protein 63 domain-containing protein n=2 Tax=Mycobacterium avium TaxID=1764 RepID=Q73V49_MYCPA|nr:hypothetical protein [Mycobacterium avium]AGL35579.1 hypothetical protein MAP4_0622 [Mycobacterium avium subsp. paratuberculosis MAP4]AAS05715.1 hypothetical protein MAP_3167c [Mycobacterium avium subsp. paratuberculosis K-10]UKO60268.1 immunity 63 family protein [Mycobacterium avium subsp. paratuberculosis]UKO64566.1 immunity 63 family protein [Mycobacterium avium subsp. paratuberculosis]UKO68870.1 immunity 63 family protein [Mycobacterium avium subsp. paratuberculosis]
MVVRGPSVSGTLRLVKLTRDTDRALDDRSAQLQTEIDQLSEKLGVRPMLVGLRTNDGLNVYVANDGSYHFTFYERGQLGFDRVGNLDDLLYWYTQSVVTGQAAKSVGDRAERFKYEYQVLSALNSEWAKRNVRETAELFRRYGQPEDISLLPDIGEPL